MTKVVINACYGGFSLSPEGEQAYLARKGKQAFYYEPAPEPGQNRFDNQVKFRRTNPSGKAFGPYTTTRDLGEVASHDDVFAEGVYFSNRDIPRDDPDLVAAVDEMQASGWAADLRVVEVPDDVAWEIEEYDGLEWVAEAHRTWS